MVKAAVQIPNTVNNFFTTLQDGKSENIESKSKVDALIKQLKSAIDYRSHIQLKPVDLSEKFKITTTDEDSKNKIYELALKLLFGSNCPNPEKIDTIIDKELQPTENIAVDIKESELNAALQALMLIPLEQRSIEITKNFISIFKGVKKSDAPDLLKWLKITIPSELLVRVVVASGPLLKGTLKNKVDILKALSEIPSDNWQGAIKHSLPLMKYFKDGGQLAGMLKVISNLKPAETETILKLSVPLLKGITRGRLDEIITEVNKLHSLRRADILQQMAPLLHGITNGSEAADILAYVRSQSSLEGMDEVIKLTAQFTKSNSGVYRLNVLKKFNQMPIPEIEEFIKLVNPLIHRFKGESDLRYIIDSFTKVASDEREELFKLLVPILRGGLSCSQFTSILFTIVNIPSHDREDVLRKAAPLLLTLDKDKWQQLIDDLRSIYPDEREHVIKCSKALFRKPGSHGGFWGSVLRIVSRIPRNEREHIIKLAAPLCQNIKLCQEQARVIEKVYELAPKERESIINSALYLVKETKDDNYIINMLIALEWIPLSERRDVAVKVVPYLTKITDISALMYVIKALGTIPKEKREAALERAWNHAQEYGPNQNSIIYVILSTPEDQWEDVKNRTVSLSKNIKCIREVGHIMSAINSFLPNDRDSIIKLAEPFLKDDDNGYMIVHLLKGINEIPQDKRARIVQDFAPLKDLPKTNLAEMFKEASGFSENELKGQVAQTLLLFKTLPSYGYVTKLFKLIPKIPSEHRGDAIACSIPLLEGFDEDARIAIITALCEVPKEQRAELVTQLVPLIKRIRSPHIIELIKTLNQIKPDERQDVISHSIPLLLIGASDGKYRAEVLQAVSEIKVAERKDIILQSEKLFSKNSHESEKAEILTLINKTPPDKREDLINRTLTLAKRFKSLSIPSIFKLANQIPFEKWEQVIETAEPLLKDCEGGWELDYVLENVYAFLQKRQEGIILRCLALLNELSGGCNKIEVLRLLLNVPEEQMDSFFANAIPLIRKTKYAHPKLLKAILDIPKERREDVIATAAPFMARTLFARMYADVLKIVHAIPPERREEVVSKAVLFMKGILESQEHDNRNRILEAIANIPADDMEDVLSSALPLMKGVMYVEARVAIIKAISSIPKEERANVMSNAAPLLMNVDKNKYGDLLTAVAQFPRQERPTILKQLTPLLVDINNLEIRALIIIAYSDFPQEERASLIPQLEVFFKLVKDDVKRIKYLKVLLLIAPSKRDIAIKIYLDNPDFEEKTLFQICNSNEEIKIVSHEYLLKLLDETISDPRKAFALATRIFNSEEDLMLHQEHPLIQKSIEVLALADPDALKNRKNPYKLYRDLKKLLETEKLLPYIPQKTSVNRKNLAINLESLRKRSARKAFTIGDLPKGVTSDTFDKLYSKLEQRLRELPLQKRAEAERYISNSFVKEVSGIKEGFMGKPLIRGLLNVRGVPSQPIESTLYYLYVLMKAILDADDVLGKFPISPQEELLLRISYSINECPTGQRDGIANYYNRLGIEYRSGKDKEALWGPEEKVAHLVDHSVQKQLNDVFSGDELLKEITKFERMNLTPHQVFYLKNRLHLQVGLIHRLIFDAHSGTILDELLDADLETLMIAFFKICTVEKMMVQLKRDIAESLASKGIAYLDLLYSMEPQILKELNLKKLDPENYPKYIEFDDDDKPLGITDEGARILLTTIGYINSGTGH